MLLRIVPIGSAKLLQEVTPVSVSPKRQPGRDPGLVLST